MTVEQYMKLPQGPPYCQLIEGTLVWSPSTTRFHQQIIGNILFAIGSYLKAHTIGEVLPSPLDVFLSPTTVLEPDVMFVAHSGKARLVDQGIEGPPDLVAEVLLPSTEHLDRGIKREICARTGVRELWLVDPVSMTVEVFDLQKDPGVPRTVHGVRSEITTPVIPGLIIPAADVFKQQACG